MLTILMTAAERLSDGSAGQAVLSWQEQRLRTSLHCAYAGQYSLSMAVRAEDAACAPSVLLDFEGCRSGVLAAAGTVEGQLALSSMLRQVEVQDGTRQYADKFGYTLAERLRLLGNPGELVEAVAELSMRQVAKGSVIIASLAEAFRRLAVIEVDEVHALPRRKDWFTASELLERPVKALHKRGKGRYALPKDVQSESGLAIVSNPVPDSEVGQEPALAAVFDIFSAGRFAADSELRAVIHTLSSLERGVLQLLCESHGVSRAECYVRARQQLGLTPQQVRSAAGSVLKKLRTAQAGSSPEAANY